MWEVAAENSREELRRPDQGNGDGGRGASEMQISCMS